MNGDQVDHPTDSYPILVQKTWSPFLNGKTARYLANIGQLQDLRALEHDVLFLNFCLSITPFTRIHSKRDAPTLKSCAAY